MFHGKFFMPLMFWQAVDSFVLFSDLGWFVAVKHLAVPVFFRRFVVVAPLFFDIMVIMTKN